MGVAEKHKAKLPKRKEGWRRSLQHKECIRINMESLRFPSGNTGSHRAKMKKLPYKNPAVKYHELPGCVNMHLRNLRLKYPPPVQKRACDAPPHVRPTDAKEEVHAARTDIQKPETMTASSFHLAG